MPDDLNLSEARKDLDECQVLANAFADAVNSLAPVGLDNITFALAILLSDALREIPEPYQERIFARFIVLVREMLCEHEGEMDVQTEVMH
jgi:hypothetical protein